ncbi:MAG: 2-hydroxyacid dehydrogenase [Candidatus Flexifilum sp.]
MKPAVFVTRRIPDSGMARIVEACEADVWPDELPPPYERLVERSRGKLGVLTLVTDRIDAAFMDAVGPQLRVISQMAVGVDNIDVAAARQRGIAIGHTPGVLTDATADLAFALLLATARRIVEAAEYVKAGRWRTWGPRTLLGADVAGATLGIIGLGRIGRAVARRASGFAMRILAYGPGLTDADAASVGAQRVDLPDLLRQSDFVSLHVPLTPTTRGLINRETLALMKPSAILINTARGPVVDQAALYAALRDGVIAAAGLDVTDPEPLPADDPLLTLPNVIVLPHIGSASIGARERMAQIAAANLIAGVTGAPLPHPLPG